jgi:hypothetical protein
MSADPPLPRSALSHTEHRLTYDIEYRSLAKVRPSSPSEVERLRLIRRKEVLRYG